MGEGVGRGGSQFFALVYHTDCLPAWMVGGGGGGGGSLLLPKGGEGRVEEEKFSGIYGPF